MSILIDANADILTKSRQLNLAAYDKAIRQFASARRYLVNGSWIEQSIGQRDESKLPRFPVLPEKVEFCFESEDAVAAVSDICSIWQFLKEQCTARLVLPDVCYNRLCEARGFGEKLNIFVPWGVRPDFPKSFWGKAFPEGAAERAALEALYKTQDKAKQSGISTNLMIMPADLYAIDVNKLCPALTDAYFGALRKEVMQNQNGKGTVQVIPWSEIRNNNAQRYNQLAANLTEQTINQKIPSGMLKTALMSAARFNPNRMSQEQKEAAYSYLRERLSEAAIVEDTYRPIKLSLVDPVKDARVDGRLPRIYILPENMRFPWLKPFPGA